MNKFLWVIVGVVVIVLVVWAAAGQAPSAPTVSAPESSTGGTPPSAVSASPEAVAVPPLPDVLPAPAAAKAPAPARQSPALEAQVPANVTVTYTDAGFSPASAAIPKGGTVTFTNNSSRAFRPASGPHPAHSGYPEPGTCNGYAFDPCGAVPVGALWSFTFNTSGTWGYHDHMNARWKGTVVVE